MSRIRLLVSMLLTVAALFAQTQVDLRTQGKSVDFSAVSSTRPVKTGTALPASCAVGELFFKSNAAAGQNLYACHAQNSWSLTAATTQARQLVDFSAVRLNGTSLQIGGSCVTTAPCNVRLGNTTYSIASPAQVTLQNGTGVALVYISASGTVTVGHNVTLSCDSGCQALAGVTAFPADSIPLATWTATSGQWDVGGLVDRRSFQSTKNLVAGVGLQTVEVAGNATILIDQAVVGLRAPVPATASSACTAGSWAADSDFFYTCTATNTWRRVAVAAW